MSDGPRNHGAELGLSVNASEAEDRTKTSLPGRLWRLARADDWGRVLMATMLVGAVLAAAGGFGTQAMPLVDRFGYWLALVLVGVALGRFGGRRLIPRAWFETRRATVGILMVFVIGLPVAVIATVTNAWMRGRAFEIVQIWDVLPSVLATTAGMVVLAFMVQARPVPATHTAPAGAPPARFRARLPAKLAGASLWAVEAEDHYLRLHTSKGQDLILLRLADALGELEGIEGARTHRSWWVARDAVAAVERAEGRTTLTLPDGAKAPVSRACAKALREAGWF